MKWGRKKSSSPSSSSSHSSIISRVFPVSSWLSKFRQKKFDLDVNKPDNKKPCLSDSGWEKGMRFYSMDEDDAYWKLSFREQEEEEMVKARKSTGGINPVWGRGFDQFRVGSREMEFTKRVDELKFSEMVSEVKKTKEREKLMQKSSTKADCAFDEIIRVKTISGESRGRKNCNRVKVKAYSPRTECKIRAIEEMKKARMRMKKKMENGAEGKTVFDSFAVVKSSFDPERDFRESMAEMIRERGIFRSEDLEKLLACYLTLNCDEYHDVIISVFREVWMEMNGVYNNDYRMQNERLF
ncbi:hypothetical protein ABFX02_08G131400 [Erythranthe guttata]